MVFQEKHGCAPNLTWKSLISIVFVFCPKPTELRIGDLVYPCIDLFRKATAAAGLLPATGQVTLAGAPAGAGRGCIV